MHGTAERFLLYHPGRRLYDCGGFCGPDREMAYLYHSLQAARLGLQMTVAGGAGERKEWRIQRVLVAWNTLGDLIGFEVIDEI